ncbi:hypothetical protein [Spirosoma validum]|uniref:Uncharacterized protein n=1 Tax=Spirosoma validum TaxID=2771355 RepID=A0A927AZ88_9BACT|nr:hypothetical protein [Spirosoma validum]MBD2752601.1 hypothetical protein [Spirosoma validum]
MYFLRPILYLIGIASALFAIYFFYTEIKANHLIITSPIWFLFASIFCFLVSWRLSKKYEVIHIYKRHKANYTNKKELEYWLNNSLDITEKYVGRNNHLRHSWIGLIKNQTQPRINDRSMALIDECINYIKYNGVYKSARNNFLGGFTDEVLVPLLATVFTASIAGAFTIGLAINNDKNAPILQNDHVNKPYNAEQDVITHTDSSFILKDITGVYSIEAADLFSIDFRPNMLGVVKFCQFLHGKGHDGNGLLTKWNKKPFNNKRELGMSILKLEQLSDEAGYKGDLWGVNRRLIKENR